MEKITNKVISGIFLIAVLLIAVLMSVRSIPNLVIYILSTIALTILYISAKKGIIKIEKKTIIVLIIIALLLRVGVFLLSYDKPLTSDYLFFYENSSNFAQGEALNNRYIATFPYLAPYIILLGTFFKIFNTNSYLIVVFMHMILDCITAFMIYKITGNEDKKIGMLGALLWLINPINIIWDTICCPVVVVNCGISCILYIFNKIRLAINTKIMWKSFLILNIIYGIIIGLFNSFRPIMIIIVIATVMYYLYNIFSNIKQKKRNILLGIGILLILSTYQLINTFSNYGISRLINQEASTTPGWTLYLGSSVEYKGMWNEKASQEYTQLFNNKEMSAEEIQQHFKEKAIRQYINNGAKNIKLFSNKYVILTHNIVGYSYSNINEVATINNLILKIIRITAEIGMFIIILLNIYHGVHIIRNVQIFRNMLLYLLVIIGLLASHMFVEVSPRYALPLMPIFTVIATFGLSDIIFKKNNLLTEGSEK